MSYLYCSRSEILRFHPIYPLSFFLYSPFKNTDYSSKYINMNTSLKKTSFVIFKKNSFLNKSKNLQFFSNLLQVILILPLFFHSFQTSQNKSEATWIYICSASIHKYTYLSLYFRGVYYPPPLLKTISFYRCYIKNISSQDITYDF